MSKTDKELAVDVAIAFIKANSVQIVPTGNGGTVQTHGTNLKNVTTIIESVHQTLKSLPEK